MTDKGDFAFEMTMDRLWWELNREKENEYWFWQGEMEDALFSHVELAGEPKNG